MRNKYLIIILLIFVLAAQTTAYAKTIIGYTNKACYVYAKPSTSSARVMVAKNTKLIYVSTYKKFYKVKVAGFSKKVYILKENVSKKITIASIWKNKVEKLDWSLGKKLVKRGEIVTLYSIEKGITLSVKRMGGINHMDIEPYTKEDTEKLLKIANGKFSWTAHPMILIANNRYIACSTNTMPHGDQTIKDNNFDGQFCLHMLNSRTHETNTISKQHQEAVQKAYDWASN